MRWDKMRRDKTPRTRDPLAWATAKVTPTVAASISVAIILIAAGCFVSSLGGCSCTRRPEWDSGLRDSERSDGAGGGGSGHGAGQGSGEGSGSGSGNGPGDGGGGLGTGNGIGGAASDSGRGGEGAGGNGASGAAADGSADGGSQAVGGQVAGNQAGTAAGAGDHASQAPAALPGRPRPKARYDAATAVQVAERHLRRAASTRDAGDVGNAYAEALEAFEAVEPHAASDDACKQMLSRAKRLCAELAESQNRDTRPRPVPTLFE